MGDKKLAVPAKKTGHVARSRVVTLSTAKDLLRTGKLDGDTFLIAPVIAILEGVHNSEFVSFEELAMFPDSWAARPLPIDHPMDVNGEAVTAGSPKVMQDSVIGTFFNIVAREDIRGITGELWIDIEKAAEVPGGDEVVRRLQAGENLEVSTAYFTIVDNIPGEWVNPKTNQVEKFTSSQFQIRPDHLALLPFDTGACSWKDGCGAPRINVDPNAPTHVNPDDQHIESEITTSLGVSMAKEVKEIKVNGKRLGTTLSEAVNAQAGDDGSTEDIVNRLAAAAGTTVTKVKALMAGTVDFAPRRWLSAFAVVLDMDPWDMFMAAGDDNMDKRHSTNTEVTENNSGKVSEQVTEVDNHDKASEKVCTPCQKSLKTKVQEILQTLGFKGFEVKEDNEKMKENAEAKKTKVDALIASAKNKFTEANREWLTAQSEEQLDLFEVPEAATETAKEVIPAVVPAVVAAVNAEVAKEVTPKAKTIAEEVAEVVKAQLAAFAESDAFKAANELVADKKVARNAKIAEIIAIENNKYTKAELETFSNDTLDKTLELLAPAPYRTAASAARNAREAVPKAPAILLAAPGVKGVDYAIPARETR